MTRVDASLLLLWTRRQHSASRPAAMEAGRRCNILSMRRLRVCEEIVPREVAISAAKVAPVAIDLAG
jgi:hypothetical protein